jgi:hypothetical protein
MWRAREKELELESKMKTINQCQIYLRSLKCKTESRYQSFNSRTEQDRPYVASCLSRDLRRSSYSDLEDGLGDDELEQQLVALVTHKN